jgi:hypothetical protein
MYLAAHSSAIKHATGFAHAAQIVYYWATLGFIALRLCTLIARIARIAPAATLPTTRRLRAALLLIGAGLALAAGQNLLALVGTTAHPGSLTVTGALALMSAAMIHTGHDLRTDRT